MTIQVELMDYYSKIEGEDIADYYAYVIDENQQRWKYAYHRQPRQSTDHFIQEVQDAFRDHREEDFRQEHVYME